jgi:pimeloyl-ACP methyl ester carboxylesterase
MTLSTLTSVLLLTAASAFAAPTAADAPAEQPISDFLSDDAPGLTDATVSTSAGGKAICISGYIDVTAFANNLNLDVAVTNATEVTALVTELVQVNSTIAKQVVKGQTNVSGTYSIYSQLCLPRFSPNISTSTIHFLIHGGGYDHRYWDPAPGYSYIDVAASYGHATFNYDRLGSGLSSHPDPIATVQKPLQVSIAHSLISSLRNGTFLSHPFSTIIGVSHSFGSNQLHSLTSLYPDSLSAAILTGYTLESYGGSVATSGYNAGPAATVDPSRWRDLALGFVVSYNAQGSQLYFLRWPNYDQALADVSERIKQPLSLGEVFGFADKVTPTNFTGPVAVVDGENDMPNCGGNCMSGGNRARELLEYAYPVRKEGSETYIVKGSGHGINFHYGAEAAYEWILEFLGKHGF